jgi:hypothetical protein
VLRGEVDGDGQHGLNVVAVCSGCAVRDKFGGWAREKHLLLWIEAATERVAATRATLFEGKRLALAPSGVRINRKRSN